MSIRTKFILAMLLTSLASTAMVGAVAYSRLMRKFDDLVLQDASRSFRLDVTAYIRTYGSWEQAQAQENFGSFSRRRREMLNMPPPGPISGPEADRPHPKPGNSPTATMDVPVPSRHDMQNQDMPGQGMHGPGMQAPPPSHLHRPPFRFYLFDTQGRALMNIPPYHPGQPMRAEEREKVLPVEVDGRTVAYFSPQGQINYSDMDFGYLSAMREALTYGVAAAALLTLVLGWIFGNRLSGALRRLTSAVEAVSDGELKQHVVVKSRDEVGVLAAAFNRMSDEIVRSHTDLRESHDQIRRQAEQLKELSIRDALTKLHNRRYFDEQARQLLEMAVRYDHPFSVMIGDIDFFKKINDKFSHAMGDAVLKQVAEILRGSIRASDIVARYGGEEFVIAFPETPLQQAAAVCEALRVKIEEYPWHELNPDLKVTMSMGLNADIHLGSVDAMLTSADGLLYYAKNAGRNRVCTKLEATV